MKIKEKLETLACYYDVTRCVGHTTAMIDGLKNTDDALVICHSNEMCKHIKQKLNPKSKVIIKSINSPNILSGYKKPLLIDNCALHSILLESLHEIQRLEKLYNEK